MKRIKTLGIAAVMALALTAALGVTSASADKFNVSVEPNRWRGSISGTVQRFNFGEVYECAESNFTTDETKTKSFEKVAVYPTQITRCLFRGIHSLSWVINGCMFVFHAGGGSGTMDIANCTKPMWVESGGCRIELDNQRGLGPVTYKNSSPLATITATAAITNITYTRTGCSSWPNGTFSNGTLFGAWTIEGLTGSWIPASTWIESSPVPPIGGFYFEKAPATVKSEYNAGGKLLWISENGGNGLTCNKFNLSGSSSSTATGTLSLVPSYNECNIASKAVPDSNISAGSCSYVLNAAGGFEIGGTGCASNPMSFTSSTGCVVTIGPQSFSEGLTFRSEGVGKLQTLSIPKGVEESASFSKLTYTATGESCGKPGTFSTAKLNIRAKLVATDSLGAAQGIWRE